MTEMINVQVDAKQVVLDWMGSNAFIPTNKKLLRQIGDTNTILLAESISQYRRWEQQGKLQEDGSFYWTQLECEIETAYSRSTQTRAYKDMEKLGLLKTESRKVWLHGEEVSVRFIKLYFSKIAELMFSNDDDVILTIKKKYEDLKKKNQESKKRAKENKMIQNESSHDTTEVRQNESSDGRFKLNHPDDSKWVTSNKDLLLKNDLEEEEEEKVSPSELVSFLISKDITLANAQKFETRLIENNVTGYTNDDVIEALTQSFADFKDGHCKSPYLWAVGKLETILDSKTKAITKNPATKQKKPTQTEVLPDWFDKKQNKEKPATVNPDEKKNTQEKKQEIERMLQQLRA